MRRARPWQPESEPNGTLAGAAPPWMYCWVGIPRSETSPSDRSALNDVLGGAFDEDISRVLYPDHWQTDEITN
jgi:hypothetical protein